MRRYIYFPERVLECKKQIFLKRWKVVQQFNSPSQMCSINQMEVYPIWNSCVIICALKHSVNDFNERLPKYSNYWFPISDHDFDFNLVAINWYKYRSKVDILNYGSSEEFVELREPMVLQYGTFFWKILKHTKWWYLWYLNRIPISFKFSHKPNRLVPC